MYTGFYVYQSNLLLWFCLICCSPAPPFREVPIPHLPPTERISHLLHSEDFCEGSTHSLVCRHQQKRIGQKRPKGDPQGNQLCSENRPQTSGERRITSSLLPEGFRQQKGPSRQRYRSTRSPRDVGQPEVMTIAEMSQLLCPVGRELG